MIQDNIPAKKYFELDSLSKSGIDKILECPAAFHYWQEHQEVKDSKALLTGSLLHMMVLQPGEVRRNYRVVTSDGRTKAGKEERREMQEMGITAVPQEIWDTCDAMTQSIFASPAGALLSKAGRAEVTVTWLHETATGQKIPAKGRIDWLSSVKNTPFILDLKTTGGKASLQDIQKHIFDYHYHRQAAWYLHGCRQNGLDVAIFGFVFVEKNPPYLVTTVALDETALTIGMRDCEEAAQTYAECCQTNEWPGYTEGLITTVGLPHWAVKEFEHATDVI